MKSVYERTNLIITEFDTEDVIITSGSVTPTPDSDPETPLTSRDNALSAYGAYGGVYL